MTRHEYTMTRLIKGFNKPHEIDKNKVGTSTIKLAGTPSGHVEHSILVCLITSYG